VPIPGTKYKRSKNVFVVTSIALTVVRPCTELLQLPAQFLVGSPGTLAAHCSQTPAFCHSWYTATCYSTLHRTASHCSALQHAATHCNTLQHATAHCTVLQDTVAHCNMLQHTATYYNTHVLMSSPHGAWGGASHRVRSGDTAAPITGENSRKSTRH